MRRRRQSLTARALRHRSGEALTFTLLSLLAVAACTFGPLYERSVEAAQLRATLTSAPVADRGLSVQAGAGGPVDPLLPSGRLRSFYEPPTRSTTLTISMPDPTGGIDPIVGSIVHRDGQCDHLRMLAGTCPSTPNGIAISSSTAAALHLAVGRRLRISTVAAVGQTPLRPLTLRVVGVYEAFEPRDDYWFGHHYSTSAGVTVIGPASAPELVADAFFAPSSLPQDVAYALSPLAQSGVIESADLPLRVGRIGLDDVPTLRRGLATLAAHDLALAPGTQVRTTLQPYLLDEVDHGRHQAQATIPAFAGELVLLILVVVGVVAVAGADRRQQSFALVRLRGGSIGQATALFGREFGALVLLSVVPGMLLAWLVCAAAGRWWLGGRAHPELRWPVVAAAAGVTLIELLIVLGVGRRTAKRSVADLLRRVPLRVSQTGIGALEAAVAAAAIAGVIVLRSGAHHNPLAVITPGLIALVAGLVLNRVVGVVAGLAGRAALWRGRLALGLAGLHVARRPGMRRTAILLCVATALIVSAVDQWSVAERNRSARADVEAGAAVVLTVYAATAITLVDGVAAADPGGRYATPVIRQLSQALPPVFAVDPAAFGRIAGWGWPSERPAAELLDGLDPPRPSPLTVSGATVRLTMQDISVTQRANPAAVGAARPGPVYLLVRATRPDGTEVATRLGPLPEGHTRAATLTGGLPCPAGCHLASIGLLRTTGDTDVVTVDARLTGLASGPGQPIALGAAADWAPATPDVSSDGGVEQTIRLAQDGRKVRLHIVNAGAPAALQHLDLPIALPAVVADNVGLTPDAQGHVQATDIDGVGAGYAPIGATPLIPGAGGPALLIDLPLAIRTAPPGLQNSDTEVWLGRDDPDRERALTAALARHGIAVLNRDSAAAHAARLAATAPAWSMQLALVTAALAVLIAALVVVLSAMTARRGRTYDSGAMALAGVRPVTLRRVALIEHVAASLLAVLVGAAVGLPGADLALPAIPMFVQDAPVPAVLRPIAWGGVVLAAVAALLVVGVVSSTVALAGVRRAGALRPGEDR